jgi:S-adenosylmethionine:diacylglycerol 3-amino-3-carboxypropyl transferase
MGVGGSFADVTPETAWEAGRLDGLRGPSRLLFGRMYEDVGIERAAFEGKRRVFRIASAGDTALSLAEQHDVVACDINPAQLAYAQRRAAGTAAEKGDAERAMSIARAFMPFIGWQSGLVREFLALSDPHEQSGFWNRHLDTQRFRIGFDILLSPAILRVVYAREFLAFLPSRFGAVVRKRFERTFAKYANVTNPYLRLLFLGESTEPRATVRANIRFVLADAASFLESCPPGSLDAFTLSNILDGAAPSFRSRLVKAVRRAAAPGALIVLRSFAEPRPGLAGNRAADDRSMLWGVVDVRSVDALEEAS